MVIKQVATKYSISLSRVNFYALLGVDSVTDFTLKDKILELGEISEVNYNTDCEGYIFITIGMSSDWPATHKKIVKTINDHIGINDEPSF